MYDIAEVCHAMYDIAEVFHAMYDIAEVCHATHIALPCLGNICDMHHKCPH